MTAFAKFFLLLLICASRVYPIGSELDDESGRHLKIIDIDWDISKQIQSALPPPSVPSWVSESERMLGERPLRYRDWGSRNSRRNLLFR